MPSSSENDSKLTKKNPSILGPCAANCIMLLVIAASIAFNSVMLSMVSHYQCIENPQSMESQVMKIVCFENNWTGCLIFSLGFAFLVMIYHGLDQQIKESFLRTIFVFVTTFGCMYLGLTVARDYIIQDTHNGCSDWLAMIYQSYAMVCLCMIVIVVLKHALYQFYCFMKRSV